MNMRKGTAVVVPWVRDEQIGEFLSRWGVPSTRPEWLVLQRDGEHEGCGATKNKGIARAVAMGAETVVVLDDDCFPAGIAESLPALAELHCQALEPQRVEMFEVVTDPPSRGTPYYERTMSMPVAASMGFWTETGDYCAARQLAHGPGPMTFKRGPVYGKYFPLCGMNIAFHPNDWKPWCDFIDVPRFDDIWMGWLWQREAYRRGFCFNLAGPLVRHSRQSNVWKNLEEEAKYLHDNEFLWRKIAEHEDGSYESLRGLLPC
jgi:hypothetical protein